ncbi:hypothetical protein BX600DRAFT_491861 [Xylariales sp. PMI_506]|nr:hypothetical protein BX600DRAFT_491861 [Xylariales sp. PMI_506]
MYDQRISKAGRAVCAGLFLFALIVWISRRGASSSISSWAESAPWLPVNQDGQSHSTQLITPNIQNASYSKVAKVAMCSYQDTTQDATLFEHALQSHKEHNDRFGYLHYVLRRNLLTIPYSKPAYMLFIILQELVKPPEERLEWLLWHDADLILMNSEVPLEKFLPPSKFDHIHLIVTNDIGGLNAGVMFIRVNDWAVTFLSAALSYKSWDPDFNPINEEQTVMDAISQRDPWKNHVMHVPQRWFNAYDDRGTRDDVPPEWNWYDHPFKPSYLIIHVPGTAGARNDLMRGWMDKKIAEPLKYNVPFDNTGYPADIASFWDKEAPLEAERQEVFWRRLTALQTISPVADRARDRAIAELKEALVGHEDLLDAALESKLEEFRNYKIESLRKAEESAKKKAEEAAKKKAEEAAKKKAEEAAKKKAEEDAKKKNASTAA